MDSSVKDTKQNSSCCSCCHDCEKEHEHRREETCVCGCGHEHEQQHEDDCDCGCAHDHGRQHHHEDSCGCGCGCGHDHSDNNKKEIIWRFVRLAAALLLFVVSFIIPAHFVYSELCRGLLNAAAVLVAGYALFWEGIRSLFRLRCNEQLLMTIAAVAALILGEYSEAVVVTVLFQIGEMLESFAVSRSQRSIDALAKIQAKTANRVNTDGTIDIIDIDQVQKNDHILIKVGEKVPVDCRVISGESTFDVSAITGESIPIEVLSGNSVLSGSINLTAAVQAEAVATAKESTASKIFELVQMSAARKGKAQKMISRFAEIYTPIVVIVAILIGTVIPLLGLGEWQDWIMRALVFLVASCPCALIISIPLTFFAAIGRASRDGILVKGSKDIEALARVNAVAFDKTGTLTTGQLKVCAVCPTDSFSEQTLLRFAKTAESVSTHPVAKAIAAYAAEADLISDAQTREIPGKGMLLTSSEGNCICGTTAFLEEQGVAVEQKIQEYPYAGGTYLAINGIFAGTIWVEDTLRTESAEVLRHLKKLGIKKAVMLTGDRPQTAEMIAEQCGVDAYHAALLPQDKVTQLHVLKQEGYLPAFVGDGINDAPVLAESEVGIAMGSASDIAATAADALLISGNLHSLPKAIRLAKSAMRVLRFNFIFSLAIKLAVLLLDLFGLAAMWMAVAADMGVTIVTVLVAMQLLRKK